jgi:hypothetical protein
VVALGPPEAVAQVTTSATGVFLKAALDHGSDTDASAAAIS